MVELYPGISGSFVVNIRTLPIKAMWWREECPVYHPYLLMSYGLFKEILKDDKQALNEARKFLHVPDNAHVMLDSGGFQVVLGKDLDPNEVLMWQINNSSSNDVVVPLDIPVSPDLDDVDHVVKHASKTAKNIELWIKKFDKLNNKTQILVPLHGYSNKTVEIWWKHVKEYVDITKSVALGGLAIAKSSVLKTNFSFVKTLLTKMKLALENKVDYIHVFGVGGKFSIAYLFYLEDLTKIRFSYDTSKFSLLVAKGTLMFPQDPFKNVRKFFRSKRYKDVELPCHCPACRTFLNSKIPKISAYTHHVHFAVTLHNLYQYLSYYDKMWWLKLLGRLEGYIVKNFDEGDKIVSYTKDFLKGRITDIDDRKDLRRWL